MATWRTGWVNGYMGMRLELVTLPIMAIWRCCRSWLYGDQHTRGCTATSRARRCIHGQTDTLEQTRDARTILQCKNNSGFVSLISRCNNKSGLTRRGLVRAGAAGAELMGEPVQGGEAA
eukprot:3725815-Rhodomonas_salina.2